MTEQSTEAPKLPAWYEPGRPLVTFADGPRVGSWSYADTWAEERRLAGFNHETASTGRTLGYVETKRTQAHRLHGSIIGKVLEWKGGAVTSTAREREDADAPTWLDKDKL